MLHKNSFKRYYGQDRIYFVVIKTFQNFPYFKEQIFCNLLIEELRICKKIKEFKLYGFCLIYDHLNLLVQPGNDFNVSKIMQFLKRHFSRDVNYVMNLTPVGDIRECRLQGGDYEKYVKFIKEHYDKVKRMKNQFIQKYGYNQIITPKFKWQKSFYDHIIRDEKDFEGHYIYTIYNFQKHNLPDNWQYTSLNYPDLINNLT